MVSCHLLRSLRSHRIPSRVLVHRQWKHFYEYASREVSFYNHNTIDSPWCQLVKNYSWNISSKLNNTIYLDFCAGIYDYCLYRAFFKSVYWTLFIFIFCLTVKPKGFKDVYFRGILAINKSCLKTKIHRFISEFIFTYLEKRY